MKKNQGFTLLELMIVIAVISILAIVAAPKYEGIKTQYRLESAAQTIISELGFAKQYAMEYRKVIAVNLTESEVQVVEDGNLIASKQFETGVKFDPGRIENGWLEQIRDSSNQVVGTGLTFDKRGFNSLSGTIVLAHSSGRTVGVQIENKTGYLSITWP
jgi:prepilin-type N-terminal cleavage/methylation domain-containing protein